MTWYRIRKDELINEEGVHYLAYGMDVCEGTEVVRSIKDIAFEKDKLQGLIEICNQRSVRADCINDVVLHFVEFESFPLTII